MRPPSVKAGSGRVVVALLGLLFMKALGDVFVASGGPRGKQAEAIEPAREIVPATQAGAEERGSQVLKLDAAERTNAAN